MARGFGDIQDNSKRDSLRESEIFEIFPLSKKANGNWVSIRLLDLDLLPIKKHWIKIMGGKDKDKEIKIPRMCVSFDPDNQNKPLNGMKCPYCGIAHGNDESGAPAQYDYKWYAQAIIRDEQAAAPRKMPKLTKNEQKTGKKEMGSESWTPVQCIPLSNSLAGKIRELGERNIHTVKDKKSGKKSKQAFQVNHPKYGCDIEIKYNAKKSPAERYTIERGDHTPLTEEEKGYLTWDFDNWNEIYDMLGRLNEEAAMADFKKMDVVGVNTNDDGDDDEDDDDDMALGRKKKGGKADKKKRRNDDDDDDEDDDDDDDEDDRPSKSKKSKPSKSRKLLDDDEDDDDEDDDDEDDRPSKKKKSSKEKKSSKVKSKKSKKSDDDDDDEDESPKKKKKKSSDKVKSSDKKKKKKSSDDDDDDAPKKKKKKKK
ncbi:single strand DNA binding protein [Dickeya phage vB_DsoM_AD1]|uniref:Putative ssDNA binding protein n=1 Tax=Dickeya phage vB_DsoM_AD1 TaxID=2283029 RepID=A0A384ZYH0_9CAUD|nr:single strand DNA binding protein [Dickeya phage vB_DsoM_AD1]AXG67282.1 putative ssDNA binding protein [Dickeya phage vB_DsoM_AD1]